MRRLSFTIFLSLLASLMLVGGAVSWIWQWRVDHHAEMRETHFTEALAAEVIPAAEEGPERLHQALQRLHRRLKVDLMVVNAEGKVLSVAGRPFTHGSWIRPGHASLEATGDGASSTSAWRGGPGRPPAGREAGGDEPESAARDERLGRGRRHPMLEPVIHRISLPDDRVLLVRAMRPVPPGLPISPAVALALLFVAVGLAAWPVSRRITRRLEALKQSVDRQAAGQLSVRAEVQGRDEVAALAQSFNRAAARIEGLVSRQEALLNSQRQLLANASHELRSPLARIRMATELMLDSPADRDFHAQELRLNIRELDELVEEILLASRLDSQGAADLQRDPVDIRGLVAEESARVGAHWQVADGVPPAVSGDSRLLRRLLRNLLENARRYHPPGDEPIGVAVQVVEPGGALRLAVLDRGRGVPEEARARIFEPFYRVSGHSEAAGGVGLGLSLVQQIARQHGGEAHHEPREGGGSCFVVTLPCLPVRRG